MLIIILILSGCDFNAYVSDNKIKTDEMNVGNVKDLIIENKDIYYIGINNKLYMVDNKLKNKKLISDRNFSGLVGIEDKKVFFIENNMKDENTTLFSLSSININGDSYKLILEDVSSAILLNSKLYYYRETGEEYDENMGYGYKNFCFYDINASEEGIIDEKTKATGIVPVLYKNKIYYEGSKNKILEYNPDSKEKREVNKGLAFYRFSDDNIYSFKGANIEKRRISNNSNPQTLLESKDIYNIWDMNVAKDYIFFLAQDTKEVTNEIFRLNLYRMRKDGSELMKIYSSDYIRDIVRPKHRIYNLGDTILLYEANEENMLSNRSKFQLIDYNGNEIESSNMNN